MFVSKIIKNVAWDASVNDSTANLPRSPVNPRASQRRVRDEFLCRRRQ